jgi:hypothetical protein
MISRIDAVRRIQSALLPLYLAVCIHAYASNHPGAPTLDGIRSALLADIKAHQSNRHGHEESQRLQDDQAALNDVEDVEGEDFAEVVRSVKGVRASTASEIVRHQCDLFLEQARKQLLEDQQRFAAEAENAIHRAAEAAVKANNTRDLDASIAELRNLAEHAPRTGRSSEMSPIDRRLGVARGDLQRWQDFLSQREAGNSLRAAQTLQNLADEEETGLDTPRSAIESRIRELEAEGKQQVETKGQAILSQIHTLDDVRPALAGLRALPFVESNYLVSIVNNLESIARTYAGLKQDIATTLNFSYSRPGDSDPLIVRLHGELLLLALPRYLRLPESEKPHPNETVEAYLQRITDLARSSSNWDLLERVLDARKQVTLHVAGTWSSDALSNYSSFTYFQRARRDEEAGQYANAVALYESALRQPNNIVPTETIAAKLEAIKKGHPVEFEAGMKTKHPPEVNRSGDKGTSNRAPGELDIPPAAAASSAPAPTATLTSP